MNRTLRRTTLLTALLLLLAMLAPAPGFAKPVWRPALGVGPAYASAYVGTVDVDSSGNAVALFPAGETAQRMQASFRRAGGHWSTPSPISLEGANAPHVVMDDKGRVTAIWMRPNGGIQQDVEVATKTRSGDWTTPVPLSSGSPLMAEPNLVLAPGGTVVAAWTRFDSGAWHTTTAVRPPGGTFGPATNLSDGSESAPGFVDLAVDSHGNVTAVWSRDIGPYNVIESRTRSTAGVWSSLDTLSVLGQDAYAASVASLPGGTTTAVWARFDGTHYVAQASTRNGPGGEWTIPKNLSTAVDVDSTDVAGGHGRTVAVWAGTPDGSPHVVQSATRAPNGTWSTAVPISNPVQNALNPSVVTDPNGNATAVWKRFNGSVDVAQGAVQPAGGAFKPAVNLSAADRNAYPPFVAVDAAGDAVAFWVDAGDVSLQARSAAFDRAGPAISVLKVPRTTKRGARTTFSVTAKDTWSRIRSYEWRFGDGSHASGRQVRHTYARAGSFRVTLVITDKVGNKTTRIRTVRVTRR
ncbi:PKD domain-containing protein [Nocardioides agariphilus]|uniref:PKD domain-containing protein n=1 Tax=Nocardioides agariphilus TaxID=433664 RepID=A0A930VN78_9ACTN|nr:PKD domain-containing protein [Nocardioides agariphilus]MBF4767840.1 PKD domain-containing protein [Nocardioides agariphilus]